MMSSGVSLAWPISCRITPRSRSSSSGSKVECGQDVGDDVEGERGVLLQHLRVVGGLLARGVGVDVAADRLDLLGDLRGGAAFGALEGHVLEEMRDAVLGLRLVARAGGDVGAERDGLDPLHPFGDDGKAGAEARKLDCFGHCGHIPLWGSTCNLGIPRTSHEGGHSWQRPPFRRPMAPAVFRPISSNQRPSRPASSC